MPITETGYEPRTQAEVLESQQNFLRATVSQKLVFSERTVVGNWTAITSDDIRQLEELIEEAHNAYDRDGATSDRLSSLAILLGVPRRETPTTGLVVQTVNLDAGQSFGPGDITFQVDGEPDNTWHNRDAVVSTGAGNYSVVFESDLTGATARATAGTLTVLVDPTDGTVNSGTNANDAFAGKDREEDDELRIRMAQAVAAGAQNTLQAIRSELVQLTGMLSADIFENRTGTVDANGLLGHSIRCVVWDGSPGVVNNDDIAQVIWDRAATFSQGSEQGTAQDAQLGQVLVNFDRATASAVTVAVEIDSASGVTKADVKAAIQAAMPNRVGAGVVFHKLSRAVFDVVGVDDFVTFTINGGTSDLPALQTTIYQLDSSDITVTGDAT